MSRINKLLTIDKEFIFFGQLDDLRGQLKNSKDINYEMLADGQIKFKPRISWGTMTMTGGLDLVDGINVKGSATNLDSERMKINLRTKVRPEHYLLIVMFIAFFIGVIFSDESKWLFLYVFGLWIICHSWFQFIYRLQENYLVDKIVKKLRLAKM
jgi:hypothetical protein